MAKDKNAPFFIQWACNRQIVELSVTSSRSCRSGEFVRVIGPHPANSMKMHIVRRFGSSIESIYWDRVCFHVDDDTCARLQDRNDMGGL